MSKIIKYAEKIRSYPKVLLSKLGNEDKIKLEKHLLSNKKYEDIKFLFENVNPSDCFLSNALKILDIEAIKIALAVPGFATNICLQRYICDLKENFSDRAINFDDLALTLENFKLSKSVIHARAKGALKLLMLHAQKVTNLTAMEPSTIANKKSEFDTTTYTTLSKSTLKFIANFFSYEEIKDYIPESFLHQFKDIFDDLERTTKSLPLLQLNSKYISSEDALLSRTYSSALSQEQARKIYQELLSSKNQMVQEFMRSLVINIANGDGVKIIFSDDDVLISNYNYINNTITVGIRPGDDLYTLASVLVHEIGHYVIDALYNLKAIPFNPRSSLTKYVMEHPDILINNYLDTGFAALSFFMGSDILIKLQEYEVEAKKVIMHAAKLLGVKASQFSPYNYSFEFIHHLKAVSTIGLFQLNADYKHNALSEKNKADDMVKEDTIFSIYLDAFYPDTCPNYSLAFAAEYILQESKSKVMTEVFPDIVKKLNLSDQQIFFLERIADFAYRVEDGEKENDQFYSELIVRYPELYVAGIGGEEIEVLENLLTYWIKYISPDIASQQAALEERCTSDFTIDVEVEGNLNSPQQQSISENLEQNINLYCIIDHL